MFQKIESVKHCFSNFIKKREFCYWLIIIVAIFLVFLLVLIFNQFAKKQEIIPGKTLKELETEQQLKELERLRQKEPPPLPKKEIQEQLRELEQLREKAKPPLTEQEIKKQLEELEELRNQ